MNWQSWTVTSVFYSFVVSVRFYSDKFDITKHKRYKQLSDYDKKNEFHVEEYMKHQMEVRLDPEEQFDLYMYEGSELEEQSE